MISAWSVEKILSNGKSEKIEYFRSMGDSIVVNGESGSKKSYFLDTVQVATWYTQKL
jgi:hypothetical protein